MKILIIVVLVFIFAIFWTRSRTTAPIGHPGPRSTSPEYLDLRKRALEFAPTVLGLPPDAPTNETWAVIMEIYIDTSNVTVTVTSFVDGNASIYLSPGGGYIGGVGKPKIRNAAMALVRAGAELQSQMMPANEFPLPVAGETVFYVRKGDRTYRLSVPTRELDGNRHTFSKMWLAGQEVITQYRLDSDGR
jgi:hypothetical protein